MTTHGMPTESLFVYDVSGLQVNVIAQAPTEDDMTRVGPDGTRGVFRDLTVHPDRSEWTDRPLR
jgi:hypothetical protein